MIIDGIDYKQVIKYAFNPNSWGFTIVKLPNYFASQCGKTYNTKTKRILEGFNGFRNKGDKKPKCKEVSVSTEGKPFWDIGWKHKPKREGASTIEFKMKQHDMVLNAWNPLHEVLEKLTKEQLIQLLLENRVIDHLNDDPTDNNLDNLKYSTSFRNSNYNKKWVTNILGS